MGDYTPVPPLAPEDLERIFAGIEGETIGFFGDLCLDLYWRADMTLSQLSRETPHFPLPVVSEEIGLGAGGNVLANLAALGPGEILAAGVVGDDWRGRLAAVLLDQLGIGSRYLSVQAGGMTWAYAKPIRRGISPLAYEDPRLDFQGAPVSGPTEEALLRALEEIATRARVVCVSDQFAGGCVTHRLREAICRLAQLGTTFVVDSRERAHLYRNVILKPNEVEGAAAWGRLSGQIPPATGLEEFLRIAQSLGERTACRICMTLGDRGSIQVADSGAFHCPAGPIPGEIDFCGAGDTFLSALTAALSAGEPLQGAARFAALASEVTIQKLGTTGVASREEIASRLAQTLME